MEFEVSYSLENEQQFWDELDDIVSADCQSHGLIDDALRSYLTFTTNFKDEYLQTHYDIARCSYKLIESSLFAAHKDYVRRQIVFSLLQEDSPDTLHLIVAFLLFDGRQNEVTFEMMSEESIFPRLVELIHEGKDDNAGLHQILLELLYEMSRIQRLRIQDLIIIEDDFITYLFQLIENLSDDANDPYHYPVIRVLLILNEQYMVSAHDPGPDQPPPIPFTNRVIKVLSLHGSAYKTFGENIILVLNRESETSLQLLILKALYLLFTTPATYEYFYTNDLRVLVDVMIRNLLDLPLSSTPLRHTYLRVLYPLLAHTQLKHPPHHKRDELQRLLAMMSATGGATEHHFGAVDETTKRLVTRCARVQWLRNDESASPVSPKKYLNVEMPGAMASSLSVVEVTTQKEKPGVMTGSREKEEEMERERGRTSGNREGTKAEDGDQREGSWQQGPVNGREKLDRNEPVVVLPEKSPFEAEGED